MADFNAIGRFISKKGHLAYALLLAFFVFAFITALASNYIAALVLLILGASTLTIWRSGSRGEAKSIASQISFANRIISGYAAGMPLVTVLKELSKEDYWFSDELAIALRRYLTGEPPITAFIVIRQLGQEGLNAIMDIIEDSLLNGTDSSARLKRAVSRMEQRRTSSLRIIGQLNNAVYINKLGSALFFPLFCGMAIQMLSVSQIGPEMQSSISAIAIVLTGFIIISNYVSNALTDPKFSEGFAWFMGLSSFGVLVFRVSSVIALNFI